MDELIEIDDDGLKQVAAALQKGVSRSVSHSAERDEILLPEPQIPKRLPFEQWSQQRQQQW
jgi:hypothetical protein